MSRGLGRIQRDIIALLEARDKLIDTYDVAADIYGLKPNDENWILLNDAQLVSVRRAFVKLAAVGKVIKVYRGHNKRAYWANERLGLWWKLRHMQEQNLHLGHAGKDEDLRANIDKMLPMLRRASELGVSPDRPYEQQGRVGTP
jgi:hypothetical protein